MDRYKLTDESYRFSSKYIKYFRHNTNFIKFGDIYIDQKLTIRPKYIYVDNSHITTLNKKSEIFEIKNAENIDSYTVDVDKFYIKHVGVYRFELQSSLEKDDVLYNCAYFSIVDFLYTEYHEDIKMIQEYLIKNGLDISAEMVDKLLDAMCDSKFQNIISHPMRKRKLDDLKK